MEQQHDKELLIDKLLPKLCNEMFFSLYKRQQACDGSQPVELVLKCFWHNGRRKFTFGDWNNDGLFETRFVAHLDKSKSKKATWIGCGSGHRIYQLKLHAHDSGFWCWDWSRLSAKGRKDSVLYTSNSIDRLEDDRK